MRKSRNEQYNKAVLKNIDEFKMGTQDAINNASQQFEMQDLNSRKYRCIPFIDLPGINY